MKNLGELIGKQCTFKFDWTDDDWNDDNTVRCAVVDVNAEINYDYELYVGFNLEPIGGLSGNMDYDDFIDVGLDTIRFD